MQDEAKMTGRMLQALDEVAGEQSRHYDYRPLHIAPDGVTATNRTSLARVKVSTGAAEEGLYRVDVDSLRPDEPVAIEQTGAGRHVAVQNMDETETVIFAGMEEDDRGNYPSDLDDVIPKRVPAFRVKIESLLRVLAVLQACGAESVEVSPGPEGAGGPIRLDGRTDWEGVEMAECVGLVSRYVRGDGDGDWD